MADDKKEATQREVAGVKAQNNQWNATPIGKMRFIESENVPNGKNGIVVIKKWQTTLGQTLYTKSFQPKEITKQTRQLEKQVPAYRQVSPKEPKQFVLNLMGISDLLDNSEFKANITIGKTLKIIRDLINGEETNKNIAKKYNVEQLFIEQIEKYVTKIRDIN